MVFGFSYSSASYDAYVTTLGAKRTTVAKGQVVTLAAGSANPVTVRCIDLNGAGAYSVNGSDENAKSAVFKVSYGGFDEVIGGDLTGSVSSGNDVETTVGPEVGDVEVYKVHHHGSRYSSNDNWLNAITPEVGVIMCGDGNTYGHPTVEALTRLHNHGVRTYWTETGAGATPDPAWDKVANGAVVVEADLATSSYTVSGPGFSDTYAFGSAPPPPLNTTQVATAVGVLQGSVTGGSAASLAADDGSPITVTSAKAGTTYAADWYGEATLAHPPLDLTVRYNGSYTVSRTQTLHLWNWATSAWNQVDQATVSTTDVTRTWTTASPGSYVSPTGVVRCRVQGSTRNKTYNGRGDYMAFQYDYAAGTIVATAQAATPSAPGAREPAPAGAPTQRAADDRGSNAGDPILAFTAVPNPAGSAMRFAIALSHPADARLQVFDLAGRLVAAPFSGRLAAGSHTLEWALTRPDRSRVPAAIYFARFEALGRTRIVRLSVLDR